jgi:hypothetical protein
MAKPSCPGGISFFPSEFLRKKVMNRSVISKLSLEADWMRKRDLNIVRPIY